jgi:signal peptidase I
LGAPQTGSGAHETPVADHPQQTQQSRLGRWFDSWMRSVGIAFVLFVVIKTFLVEAFQIPSGSMERTLLIGDFLFVNKAVYGAQIPGTHARLPGFEAPRRGDVIVFAYPKDPTINFVKRVVAIPGDTVEMQSGRLRLNGRFIKEPYIQRLDPARDVSDPSFAWQRTYLVPGTRRDPPTRDNWGPIVVPDGFYFTLGDNRDNSLDSRYWGFVDAAAVKGRPMLVYFSYDREAHDALPWLTDIRWRRLGSFVH